MCIITLQNNDQRFYNSIKLYLGTLYNIINWRTYNRLYIVLSWTWCFKDFVIKYISFVFKFKINKNTVYKHGLYHKFRMFKKIPISAHLNEYSDTWLLNNKFRTIIIIRGYLTSTKHVLLTYVISEWRIRNSCESYIQ